MVERRGRWKTVCARGAWPAWSRGPSTSPLEAMLDAEPNPGRTRRLVFVYAFSVLSLIAIIAAAIWLMPRLPGEYGIRYLAGITLVFVCIGAWSAVVKSVLSEDDARRLLEPKKRDDE